MNIKEKITNGLFRLYYPFIVRKEKLVALRMWRDGVRQCVKMYQEIGGPRVYLFFDRKHMVWSPMTYEPNKAFKPSIRIMQRMGKMHGANKINSVATAKQYCYYYTPSKWGALGCQEDNHLREEKAKLWTNYYMLVLSEPMRKVRDYLQSHPHLNQSLLG